MARIPPLEPPFDAETAAQLATMMPPGRSPIALFRTLARNLPMATAMTTWGRYELGRTLTLTARDRELLILRTCARCSCEYEWGVHVMVFAARADLTPAQITSLTHGTPADPCWTTDRERCLIELADSLHDTSDVADDLWDSARRHLTEMQLLDALLLCGWYHAISFAARGARVELEPDTPRFNDALPT